VDIKQCRSTQINHNFDCLLLRIREWDSLKMRHDAAEIMDYHGFFLHGTELGRLDIERQTVRVLLLFDLHLWQCSSRLEGHNRAIGTRIKRDSRDHRAGELRRSRSQWTRRHRCGSVGCPCRFWGGSRQHLCITGLSLSQGNQKLTTLDLHDVGGHMLQIDHAAYGPFFRHLQSLNTADDSSHREWSWQVTERCLRESEHQARGIL